MTAPSPTAAQPSPVSLSLVGDQVYEAIEVAILNGALPGGTRLRVRQLAEMVGTSVMPVRDAIRRLEEVGLATRMPNRGAVVKEFTVVELIDVYSVRMITEVEAARAGAEKVDDAGLQLMQEAVDEMQAALDDDRPVDAMLADTRMLRVLYTAGGNTVLLGVIENLWRQCHYYRVMAAEAAAAQNDRSLFDPAVDILAAARLRDADSAAYATRQSLVRSRRRLQQRLEDPARSV